MIIIDISPKVDYETKNVNIAENTVGVLSRAYEVVSSGLYNPENRKSDIMTLYKLRYKVEHNATEYDSTNQALKELMSSINGEVNSDTLEGINLQSIRHFDVRLNDGIVFMVQSSHFIDRLRTMKFSEDSGITEDHREFLSLVLKMISEYNILKSDLIQLTTVLTSVLQSDGPEDILNLAKELVVNGFSRSRRLAEYAFLKIRKFAE